MTESFIAEPFSYELFPEQIAQRPCSPAHAAKMLVISRETKHVEVGRFMDLPTLLTAKDLLIFNDSQVIPARLFGKKGQTEVELLLLKEIENGVWESLGRPLRKLKTDDIIEFAQGLSARFIGRTKEDGALVEFKIQDQLARRDQVLAVGLMPIPPYIRSGRSDAQDSIDYQTCFAKVEGSIAAPTASLHFTEELLEAIRRQGCALSFLTLHVGLSSIRELELNSVPGSERFTVSQQLVEQIKATKGQGGRVIAVGTTVVRALETAALAVDLEKQASTDLFIQPGFEFKFVDAIVTNFHLPKSTHLLLVEAFLKDRELLKNSYELAFAQKFRLLSYGDGMFIT